MHNIDRPDDFRGLRVWQKAADLCVTVYSVAQAMRALREFELMHQLKESALSVPANIAEGNGRGYRRDYARFVSFARGSTRELQSHLVMVERLDFAAKRDLDSIQCEYEDVSRMLYSLQQSLLE